MGRVFRVATTADLSALTDLERLANLAALGHVFPPERYPFPDDAVLARWALVLDDQAVVVLVLDDEADPGTGLVAFAAFDDTTLRHLAVRPDHWGQGVATRAIATVLAAIEQRGISTASLWCLEENHRARRLYEHLGWLPTDDRQEAPWRPHPVEMRYTRTLGRAER
jgi:GNAT superfamily N-acetyltransferase